MDIRKLEPIQSLGKDSPVQGLRRLVDNKNLELVKGLGLNSQGTKSQKAGGHQESVAY